MSFESNLVRVSLPMLLLAEMNDEAGHGYALATRLHNRGIERIKGATLYPALAKLENAGLCSSHWEEGNGAPGRKVYAITTAGKQELILMLEQWRALTATVTELEERAKA